LFVFFDHGINIIFWREYLPHFIILIRTFLVSDLIIGKTIEFGFALLVRLESMQVSAQIGSFRGLNQVIHEI
jgi:hypothetical protein